MKAEASFQTRKPSPISIVKMRTAKPSAPADPAILLMAAGRTEEAEEDADMEAGAGDAGMDAARAVTVVHVMAVTGREARSTFQPLF